MECEHDIKEDGICISCGLCSEYNSYEDPVFLQGKKSLINLHSYKYAVKNQFKTFEAVIKNKKDTRSFAFRKLSAANRRNFKE